MQLFLQTFVLGVCVAAIGAVVLSKTWNLSVPTRVILGVVIAGVAFFAARSIQRISTPTARISLSTNPPAPAPQESRPTGVVEPHDETDAKRPVKEQSGSEPVAPTLVAEGSPANLEDAEALAGSPRSVRVEVLYDGPTAAGGVVSPKDIMSKELSDVGFEVLLGSTVAMPEAPRGGPSAPRSTTTVHSVTPTTESVPQARPAVSQPPSGLTVKEIFDFVRKAQQGSRFEEPKLPSIFQFLSRPLFAATPPIRPQIAVAMRSSIRRLREYQGIFSTEAQMEIVAVAAHGKRILSVVTMAGPDSARGFGLDWEQAEEKALREISSKMCSAFAKQLQQKLAEEK